MTSVPSERPRFTTFDTWNHQPGLWIVTVLSIAYSTIVFVIRHIIRRKFTRADAALCAGYALAACSYGLMFAGLENGAGKAPESLTEDSYRTASKLVYAGIIFLLLACGCATCSQLCLLEEIVPEDKDKRLCWASITLCSCVTIISPVIVSAGCSATQTLNSSPTACPAAPIARWSAVAVLTIINLLIPALLPLYLFRKLHTALNRKLGIYAAFAFPLASIPVAGTAVSLYVRFINHGNNGTSIVSFLCCLEVLLGWALICPTIPIGRPIAMRFATGGTLILGEYGSNFTDGGNDRTISEPPTKRGGSLPSAHGHNFNADRFMYESQARGSSTATAEQAKTTANAIRKTVTMETETVDAIQFLMRQEV